MNLEKLIELGNSLADDQIPVEQVHEFVNDAIAAINIEVGSKFPMLTEMTDEPVIPEQWQRMLLVPYTKARIKEQDSSQFEWEIGYEQFFENLLQFKKQYDIPEEYVDTEIKGNISKGSILDNKPYLWGGW